MPRRTPRKSPSLDRFALYELAVTAPLAMSRFLRAVHAGSPRILREDFSGTAALARGWLELDSCHRAIAVDAVQAVVRLAERRTPREHRDRLRVMARDVMACRLKADIVAATNFPLGYFHDRLSLLKYLRHARACLRLGGVLVADLYGGESAFRLGTTRKRLRGPNGERITYHWEQRDANAVSSRVLNAIHFDVREIDGTMRTIRDAFVYDWRLWSMAELKDAMLEAGFRAVEVHDSLGEAVDHLGNAYVRPMDEHDRLDPDYVVYVIGRA
ncbi:MAG: hypothetical protein AB7Q00_00690 [Phycisphaerales bacterium]|nr:MAG: hypothetical protein IPK69_05285 [Phycisphaerales bacterium]